MSLIDSFMTKVGSDSPFFGVLSEFDPFSGEQNWVHSGSPSLDYNLGTFGFPPGIVEIAGKSKGGKTTVALHTAAEHQKKYGENSIVVIFYSEKRGVAQYAERIGINTDNVIVAKFRFVEELFLLASNIFDMIDEIWKTEKRPGKPQFHFIWDSLGATLSRSEHSVIEENAKDFRKKQLVKGEEDMDYSSAQPGAFAKQAKLFAKYILAEIYKREFTFVIINHLYDLMGGPGAGRGKKSTGGEWIEYMPTMRIRVTRIKDEEIDDIKVVQQSVITVEKNDFGGRADTPISILFGYGLILSQDELDFAVEQDILQLTKSKYSFMDGKLSWSSRREYYQMYRDGSPFLKILHNKIAQAYHAKVLSEKAPPKKVTARKVDEE